MVKWCKSKKMRIAWLLGFLNHKFLTNIDQVLSGYLDLRYEVYSLWRLMLLCDFVKMTQWNERRSYLVVFGSWCFHNVLETKESFSIVHWIMANPNAGKNFRCFCKKKKKFIVKMYVMWWSHMEKFFLLHKNGNKIYIYS